MSEPEYLGVIGPDAIRIDAEADAAAEIERQVIGTGEPRGFDGFLAALGEQPPREELPAVALEPDTLPNHPLRASDVPALLAKEIG